MRPSPSLKVINVDDFNEDMYPSGSVAPATRRRPT